MHQPRKRLSADDRRTTTVESVIELAAEQNPSEITTAAIATHMHLTQGALFRHFPSKDAIWQAAMEWVTDRLLGLIERAVSGAESPLAALEAMYLAHIGFVIEHPGVPRIIFGELQRADDTAAKRMVQTLHRRYGERLRALIEDGKANSELDPQLNVTAAATLFIGSIQGLIMQALLLGDSNQMRKSAPAAFTIYRRGIVKAQR